MKRPEVGMLIKMKGGGELLVGDVNANMGYCDCCKENRQIVSRKVVYTKPEAKEVSTQKRTKKTGTKQKP